eukprot:765171-Hanusia_phi.AAC.2
MAVIAGTAVFFSAEENAAETKIWDREMAGIRNATALPEQLARKFLIRNNLVWKQAEDKCKSYGAEVCPMKNVCKGKSPEYEPLSAFECPDVLGSARKVLCTERGRRRCSKKDEVCSSMRFPPPLTSLQRQLQSRWVPVKVDSSKQVSGSRELGQVVTCWQWVSMDDCSAVEFPEDKKMRGVIACCGKLRSKGARSGRCLRSYARVGSGHMREQSGLGKRKYKPGQGDSWSQHEYVDKMRSSDPFLAHKQSGTKVKSFHEHVARDGAMRASD